MSLRLPLIRLCGAWGSYQDFLHIMLLLKGKLLTDLAFMLKSSLHDMENRYGISVPHMITDITWLSYFSFMTHGRILNKGNTTGATNRAGGTVYPSGAPAFTIVLVGFVLPSLCRVLSNIFVLFVHFIVCRLIYDF